MHFHGSAYKVLSYNDLINKSIDPTSAISKDDAVIKLDHFILQNFNINDNKLINIAAKNPQNDLKFIKKHLENAKINSLYHPRLVDPAILFHINEMTARGRRERTKCADRSPRAKTVRGSTPASRDRGRRCTLPIPGARRA